HRHIGGPKLPPDATGAKPRDVGHQLRLADGEVHGIEAAEPVNRVWDVVVAVDEGNGLEDANGWRVLIVGRSEGLTIRRSGAQQRARQQERDYTGPPTVRHALRHVQGVQKLD